MSKPKGAISLISRPVKECINGLTIEYLNSEEFKKDFADLEPRERIQLTAKLLEFTTPKATTTLDIVTHTKTIEDTLAELCVEPDPEEDM